MRALVPYKDLEIGQRNPLWQPPNFYLTSPAIRDCDWAREAIEGLDLYPVDQPFILGLRHHTRHRALASIRKIAHTCTEHIRHHDSMYTLHWWSRTLSNAHAGELVVAFRLLGIYELSHPSR